MRFRRVIVYALAGCVLGGLAGLAAGGAFSASDPTGRTALALMCVAGGLLASAGAIASSSRRAAMYDCPAGILATGLGLYGTAHLVAPGASMSTGARAASVVALALVVSATLGAVHTWRHGWRIGAPAAVFAGIGGLAAVVAATQIISEGSLYATSLESGAIFGALVWGAVGLAKMLFGVDVEAFRVS